MSLFTFDTLNASGRCIIDMGQMQRHALTVQADVMVIQMSVVRYTVLCVCTCTLADAIVLQEK